MEQQKLAEVMAERDAARDLLEEIRQSMERVREDTERGRALRQVQANVLAESVGGRIPPYPWKLRKMIYGWLSRLHMYKRADLPLHNVRCTSCTVGTTKSRQGLSARG